MRFFDAEVSAAADECIVIGHAAMYHRAPECWNVADRFSDFARSAKIFQLLTVTVRVAPRIAGRNSRSDTA